MQRLSAGHEGSRTNARNPGTRNLRTQRAYRGHPLNRVRDPQDGSEARDGKRRWNPWARFRTSRLTDQDRTKMDLPHRISVPAQETDEAISDLYVALFGNQPIRVYHVTLLFGPSPWTLTGLNCVMLRPGHYEHLTY